MVRILPVFLPFAACGNRCLFCDQKAVTRTEETADAVSSAETQIAGRIGFSISWDEIAFYGGNFGALPSGVRKRLYDLAKSNGINCIRFSTRPDTITDRLVAEIKENGVTFVELGVQSLDDNVLAMNGRPYCRADVFAAIDKVLSAAPCGVQLMTGMYGQSMLSSLKDAEALSVTGVAASRIYPTLVLKNTPLFSIMEKGLYEPARFADTLLAAAGMYVIFKSENVNVIRMGLPNDAASDGCVAAGPYHKAFGDLVKTLVALLYFESGGRCRFFGYKGAVKRFFRDVFPPNENAGAADFGYMCRRVRRYFLEDCQRFLEGKAAGFAERLCREAYDR